MPAPPRPNGTAHRRTRGTHAGARADVGRRAPETTARPTCRGTYGTDGAAPPNRGGRAIARTDGNGAWYRRGTGRRRRDQTPMSEVVSAIRLSISAIACPI